MSVTLTLFISISLCPLLLIKNRQERFFLFKLIIVGWCFGLPLLALVNNWLPFSGGGDDWNYFQLAATPIRSFADIIDFGKFQNTMVQPGYPLLLSIVSHISGHNLFTLKALNLLLFLLLVFIWYQIGKELEGEVFGRKMAVIILCCTPLWYYVFVLQKDMIIVALQSLFLLGVVRNKTQNDFSSWIIIIVATLAVIPFRTPLVLVNASIVAMGYTLQLAGSKKNLHTIVKLFVVSVFVLATFYCLSNPAFMARLGIVSETRMLGPTGTLLETAQKSYSSSQMNRPLFPLLYILNETSGFNPETWKVQDASWLRGVTIIPWVMLGVPMLFLGTKLLIPRMKLRSPWLFLFLFASAYMVLSWQSGDTTRWRLSDMPVLTAIALYGWYSAPRQHVHRTLITWFITIATLFSMLYLFKEFR